MRMVGYTATATATATPTEVPRALRVRSSPLRMKRAGGAATTDTDSSRRLVVGLNKSSHDAAVCVVDVATSEIIFACEKERLTRKKHDAGGMCVCVRARARVFCGCLVEVLCAH